MKITLLLSLLIYFTFVNNNLFGQNTTLVFSGQIMSPTLKLVQKNIDKPTNFGYMAQRYKTSLGAGVGFYIGTQVKMDSSNIYWSFGLNQNYGNNTLVADQILNGNERSEIWQSNTLNFLPGIGFRKYGKLPISIQIGPVIPLFNNTIYRLLLNDGTNNFEASHRVKFYTSMGFYTQANFNLKLNKRSHLIFGAQFLALNRSIKSKKIIKTDLKSGQPNYAKNKYGEEINYIKSLNSTVNDESLNAQGVDYNKARVTLSQKYGFSNLAFQIGFNYLLN